MDIPKKLEIQKPDFPDPRLLGRDLSELYRTSEKEDGQQAKESKPEEVVPSAYVKATIGLATNAWRLRSRLFDSLTNEPREEVSKDDVKKMVRYVEAIYDTFAAMGIEIKDRTGEAFDYGLIEKVITALPQQGLKKERIIETVRPTIKWNNTTVQEGEVIIATPIETSDQTKSL
jgi:hypothetical protein